MKAGRVMRKVVSKRPTRPGGGWFPYFYAKLACGHEVLHETGARDPESKRCEECERILAEGKAGPG